MQTNVLTSTAGMDREDWLQWRNKGLGGSDVAAIAGLSKWKSPLAVWLEKVGQIEPSEVGEAAYWGNRLEDIVADEFTLRTGIKVRRKNAILQHPEYPFMLANVDRMIVGEDAGLECKTANEYFKDQWDEDEKKLPDAYMLQIQHYMAVTGCASWYVAVLIGGNKFVWFKVDRDQELIDHLIKIESDFWELVTSNIMPPVDGSDATKDILDKMYPNSNENSIALPSEANDILKNLEHCKEMESEWTIKKQECENQLKQMLGDNESGHINEQKVKWKTVNTNRLDSKSLKKELPRTYEQFCKESSYRKFTIS